MRQTSSFKNTTGAIRKVLAVSVMGALLAGSAFAAKPDAAPKEQFLSLLQHAIQIWSGETKQGDLVADKPHAGQFFTPPGKGSVKLASKNSDDGSSDDKSSDDKSSDDKSSDDKSSDDKSSDDKSSDDKSSDDKSDDHSSDDSQPSCMPQLSVEFHTDNLTVSVASDKKLKSVILLFHDGTTQQVAKVKGKSGVFAGIGAKAGEVLTGVWVRSGCNYKNTEPGVPCPSDDDDSSSDDGSSSDDDSSSRDHNMSWSDALAGGECDDGDISCLEALLADDGSSDDKSDDGSSDDDSSSDDKSDDGSSDEDSSSGDDDSSRDKPKKQKCGVFFPNEMAQVMLPVISIGDAAAIEGSNSDSELEFLVMLSEAVPEGQVVEVEFATRLRPETALPPATEDDFAMATGILIFEAGSMSQSIFVTVIADDSPEGDEAFDVVLTNPVNANIGDGEALGVILNDDDLDE